MTNHLDELRISIDAVDAQIMELLSQRMQLVQEVGEFKQAHNIAPLDQKRWQAVLASKLKMAEELGLNKDMIHAIYESIHQAALKLERSVKAI